MSTNSDEYIFNRVVTLLGREIDDDLHALSFGSLFRGIGTELFTALPLSLQESFIPSGSFSNTMGSSEFNSLVESIQDPEKENNGRSLPLLPESNHLLISPTSSFFSLEQSEFSKIDVFQDLHAQISNTRRTSRFTEIEDDSALSTLEFQVGQFSASQVGIMFFTLSDRNRMSSPTMMATPTVGESQ